MEDSPNGEVEVQPVQPSEASINFVPAWETQPSQVNVGQANPVSDPDVNLQNKNKSKLPLRIFLTLLIAFFAVSLAALIYFFFFVPRTTAEIFVSEMSRDFDLTILGIQNLATNKKSDKNSFEISRGSFFVIPSLRSSIQAEKEIAQDTPAINAILSRIKLVKDQQSKLAKPLEVQDLNTKIDKYYSALGDATTVLSDYENFQVKILAAQGSDYNTELAKFGEIYKAGGKRSDVIAYFTKLVGLGDKSIEKLKALGGPPKDQVNFYHYVVDSDVDRTDSLKKVLVNNTAGAKNGDALLLVIMSDYLKRQEERDNNNIASTQALVVSSLLRASFDKVITQEDVLKDAFSSLKKKYEIAEPLGDQSTQPTSSAAP